jgi:ferredoxin
MIGRRRGIFDVDRSVLSAAEGGTIRGRRPMSVVIGDRCTACGACIATCPDRALKPAPKRPDVDAQRCTLCLACVEICPRDAICERATASEPTWQQRSLTKAPKAAQ